METPGQILKRERETSGTTLKEIASITRIPVSALRNLEEDRYDLFPAEVFAKGFLRNYCRELHVNVDEVMLAYNALKQQQRRRDVQEPAVAVTPDVSRPRKIVEPAAVKPLMLSAPEGDRDTGNRPVVDNSQRTFRFAYLVVFLVVASSLALSVVFTNTGEAEENERRRVRPAVEQESDKDTRWLMDDEQNLSTPSSTAAADDDVDLEPASEPEALTPNAQTAPAAAPERPTSATDPWSRPAFPEDDQD